MSLVAVFGAVFILVSKVLCNELLVQINVNKANNIVSSKCISFAVNPKTLSSEISSEFLQYLALQENPAYVKIVSTPTLFGNNTNKDLESDDEVSNSLKFFKDISELGWIPIIPLPYQPGQWNPSDALNVLNISSAFGVRSAIWQLGLDFDATGASVYISDLKTLRTMVDAFQNFVDDWRVIGADITAGSNAEETKLYVDLSKPIVEAVGWTQSNGREYAENQRSIFSNKDLALKAILSRDVKRWLSISSKFTLENNSNKPKDLKSIEILQEARLSVEALNKGFHVVFRPIDSSDMKLSLNYFLNLLFKKVMGEKVLDVKISTADSAYSYIYSHCAANIEGGLAIMAINIADEHTKIVAKIAPTKFTGPELWQYILTTSDDVTLLNGDQLFANSTLEPFIKIKHPNRPISLIMPPKSIGFWTLPLANLTECLKENLRVQKDINSNYVKDLPSRSSSDALLQLLITEKALAKHNNLNSPKLLRKRRLATYPTYPISRSSNTYIQKGLQVKPISVRIEKSANFIPREVDIDDFSKEFENYHYPRRYLNIQRKDNPIELDFKRIARQNSLDEGMDKVNVTTESGAGEETPKFMLMLSDKVSKFMKMLNHHVGAWWNTWA